MQSVTAVLLAPSLAVHAVLHSCAVKSNDLNRISTDVWISENHEKWKTWL